MLVRTKMTFEDGMIYPSEILFEGSVPECFEYIKTYWLDELSDIEIAANCDDDDNYRLPEYWRTHVRLNVGRFAPEQLSSNCWVSVLGIQQFNLGSV